ncbi:MAG: beta-ketoacyl-[acyl-carrier-protein] synthase I [Desulfobulbaceae bacterium A2]|nr:MAG: beta-ketoacyl-[acyl-carrier-protein] synthase I [Desulfobulbaceae bacterium A2]
MRRVVVTGMGIVSPLGNSIPAVLESLRAGRSGVRFQENYREIGLKSQVGAFTDLDVREALDKKTLRFMGKAAAYACVALRQAIASAGLPPELVSRPRTGLIMGSGGTSAENVVETADIVRSKGARRLGPFMVPRTMSSTVSAALTAPFQIKGLVYSISSACATGAHCIGAAMEQIQAGRQDIVFAGGADEEHWTQTCMFDAMGALSSNCNHDPMRASRPYDIDRDGFVVANGAGVLVLEEREHALRRGAPIVAELTGYAATADGYDTVAPSGEGAVRCMRLALEMQSAPVEYINAHGTGTPIGDIVELQAIREVFGQELPRISSTKSLSGHSLGAAGVHEAIYSILMLCHDFIAASAHIDRLDPQAAGMPIVTERQDGPLNGVLSNSFGFGGTNACLIFQRHHD